MKTRPPAVRVLPDRAQILQLLIQWKDQYDRIETVDQQVDALTKRAPESPLFEALWTTFECYSTLLETFILGNAKSAWLEYFAYECHMGQKLGDVTCGNPGDPGYRVYHLNDLEALATFLSDSQ